jgi:hypothetical protein
MYDPRENALGYTKEEEELRAKAKDWAEHEVVRQMRDERRQREREEQLKQQWENTEEGRLFQQLANSFAACKRLLKRNAEAESQARQLGGKKYDVYSKLIENLDHANRAPRCCYLKMSGELCRAPKMRGQEYCCMHLAMMAAKEKEDFTMPPLDDANAVQAAITRCARGLLDGTLDEKRAMRVGYFLQLAVTNVGRVNFEPVEQQ